MEEQQVKSAEPTPEQLHARATEYHAQQWGNVVAAERMRIAKARGLFNDPSVIPTAEELIAAVPLEGDTIRYAKDKDGNDRLATDSFGFPARPKQQGRRRPHMTKHQQLVKSTSLTIFRTLFSRHISKLEKAAQAAGEVFHGVPNDDLPKLGARATVLGARIAKAKQLTARRLARNRQKLSRRINAGTLPGNTNVRAYCIN